MFLKVLFNNEAGENFSGGWGLSFLIDGHTLFDTGEKIELLLHNMQQLGVAFADIKRVVISHDHWDHTGGLWELLKQRKGLTVYACPKFSQEFKSRVKILAGDLIEIIQPAQIAENIFITGEIPGKHKGDYIVEQALIITTEKGLVVVTGCAHPGIIRIIKIVKAKFLKEKIHLVIGGFHLKDKTSAEIEDIVSEFKKMQVEKVGPIHCSGEEAERKFKEQYQDDFLSIKAGQIIEI